MDIKVITRHAPSNYGSLLQAIATQTVLERLGHRCEIIDYVRDDEHGLKAVRTTLKKKPEWNHNILKEAAYIILRYPVEKLAEAKFSKMRKRYLKLTQRFRIHDEMMSLDADIFMTGSDQVWGPTLNGSYDSAYFLTFVANKPIVAYAASFGKADFPVPTVEKYRQMLSAYSGITVRENRAVALLNEWGVPNYGQVLDPTLLLDFKIWSDFAEKNFSKHDYILVYEIHNNPELDAYAKNFSKNKRLPLIRVSAILHQISRGGKFVYRPDVKMFLSYIKNCSYLITDSFHGTVFGIIFNKEIIEVMPNNSTGSRNYSLLQLTGLTGRIVKSADDFSPADNAIDYGAVNAIIARERKTSLDKLQKLLNV